MWGWQRLLIIFLSTFLLLIIVPLSIVAEDLSTPPATNQTPSAAFSSSVSTTSSSLSASPAPPSSASPSSSAIASSPLTNESTNTSSGELRQQSGGSEANGGTGEQRALAAPILRGRQQLESDNAVELNGEKKTFFKIHYRDGIQKAIFDETQQRVPMDFEDTNGVAGGEFDAYEDSRLVDPRLEQPLFIPEIYRNDTLKESGAKQPPPQATTRLLVAPELQSRAPITVRTTTSRPTIIPPSIRPAQPFGRPPAPAAPQPNPLTPQRPSPSFSKPPQSLPTLRPSVPQQPRLPQVPQPPPFPPPLPSNQQRPPTPNAGVSQLRTGVCQNSIFYTPQTVTELDIQRIYTHFAVVVSVDQCARTCHEFNCDVAIMDPITRHCQFNPSTAFRLHPSCPQWPNPLYRNNVPVGQDPVRIACVTCQQRRRIQKPGQSSPMPFNGHGRQPQQTVSAVRRPPVGQQQLPQHVIRTTVRDRIDAGSQVRIANAAPLHGGDEAGRGGRDLSAEFHKLERLLKSAEDYLDEAEQQVSRVSTARVGRRHQLDERKVGKEVPSWKNGHPQGEGFSPLKINPLRRPFLADLSRPQAVFYSTDSFSRKRTNSDEFHRRAHRRVDEREETPLLSRMELPASAGQKTEE